MIKISLDTLPDLRMVTTPESLEFVFQEAIDRLAPSKKTEMDQTERAAIAVTVCDKISSLLQSSPSAEIQRSISTFLKQHRGCLLDGLQLEYATASALRFEKGPHHKPRRGNAIVSSEMVAKCKAYSHALHGAEFLNVMDINGTLSNLDSKFFPETRKALERALSMGKVYLISSDPQSKIIENAFMPKRSKIITGKSVSLELGTEVYTLHKDRGLYKQMVLISESGLRRLDYDEKASGFVETPLSRGLTEQQVAFIEHTLSQDLLSSSTVKALTEQLREAGLEWTQKIAPGTFDERKFNCKIGDELVTICSLTIALFGDLTEKSREKLRDPDAITDDDERRKIKEVIRYREHLEAKINLLFNDIGDFANKFQIGGIGSIDIIVAPKGDIAYEQAILPLLRDSPNRTRPIVVATYGDRTQDRFGNDSSFRDISRIHGNRSPAITTLSFECSGARTAFPIDLQGQNTLYTTIPATHGGTARALQSICDAAVLSNFVFDQNLL